MNPRSLTFRLVAWYCGLLLLIGSAFAVYSYADFTTYAHQTILDALSTRARDAENLARPLLDDRAALAAAMQRRFAPESHDRFMRLTIDNHVLYISDAPPDGLFEPRAVAGVWEDSRLREQDGLWIYSRLRPLAGGHQLLIEVGQLDEVMTTAGKGLRDTLMIALPVLLGIAALGGYWLVRHSLTPVATLINAAEALTFNSPQNRLPPAGTGDLLDELAGTLNRMLERLDSSYQLANRFSADAAHELRTPLAILRGELEFIGSRRDLAPETHKAAVSALDEAIRLGQIVDSLLILAVIDGGSGKRAHRPVDLQALAFETIEQMRLLADDKKIALTCAAAPPVPVPGDRNRLKQVLVNLLDNAIKYTPAGGSVRIDVTRQGEQACLEVADTGIGISPGDQANVFERFFRVDPDRGASGAGLGLAIARSICQAHGGSITLRSSPGQGSTFTVLLPRASSHSNPSPETA